MIASLYICSKSFYHNGNDSDEDVYRKIVSLKGLIDKVLSKYSCENHFFVDKNSFMETPLFSDSATISDIVCRKREINKDVLILFLKILSKFKECSLDTDKLLEYLDLEDENNCHGVIVLNQLKEIPEPKQILTNFQSWLEFRRHFLGKYPKTPDYFLSECEKYFVFLILHQKNSKTLKSVLNTHSNQIVRYLSCINDCFVYELSSSNKNFPEFLSYFATKYQMDGASFEGTKERKFCFEFTQQNGTNYNAYCEPHLKMYKDDLKNDGQHCRIYFQKPQDSENIIYVGHVGKHL